MVIPCKGPFDHQNLGCFPLFRAPSRSDLLCQQPIRTAAASDLPFEQRNSLSRVWMCVSVCVKSEHLGCPLTKFVLLATFSQLGETESMIACRLRVFWALAAALAALSTNFWVSKESFNSQSTVDGQNPAPKKPWNDSIPRQIPTNNGFNHGSKGCMIQ